MSILLETKNLQLEIGGKIICRDLNLQINAGEIWGVLGPNGSGKTTLLHALAGLHASAQGETFLSQKNLSDYTSKQRARQVGLLFQDAAEVFSQTVFEFCLAARYPYLTAFDWESCEDKAIVQQALQQMHLENFSSRKVESLSGGERRRLNIAALLAQTPHIYLLDEPTNHLDINYQALILRHFKQLAANTGIAILASLHDLNAAQYFCNKVLLLMENGEILQGSTQEIFTRGNLERLYQQTLHAIPVEKETYWIPVYDL